MRPSSLLLAAAFSVGALAQEKSELPFEERYERFELYTGCQPISVAS